MKEAKHQNRAKKKRSHVIRLPPFHARGREDMFITYPCFHCQDARLENHYMNPELYVRLCSPFHHFASLHITVTQKFVKSRPQPLARSLARTAQSFARTIHSLACTALLAFHCARSLVHSRALSF